MLVRKSKIAGIIKKERQKERISCEKTTALQIKKLEKKLFDEHKKNIETIEGEFKQAILQKEKEIKILKKEIESNHQLYREVRKREKHLEDLTFEVEDIVDTMVIKVQESLQPFYRARSKVETAMRKSDKNHDKVESIFRAVK